MAVADSIQASMISVLKLILGQTDPTRPAPNARTFVEHLPESASTAPVESGGKASHELATARLSPTRGEDMFARGNNHLARGQQRVRADVADRYLGEGEERCAFEVQVLSLLERQAADTHALTAKVG